MMSEFDIVFDSILEDVFPKLDIHIQTNNLIMEDGNVDIHEIVEFLTDVEGYDTDMANRIWDTYLENNQIINTLLRSNGRQRAMQS
tara:strand:- start:8853 stop:9110 length:258 start_codon:yes stop_codon:yes gene_type:complete